MRFYIRGGPDKVRYNNNTAHQVSRAKLRVIYRARDIEARSSVVLCSVVCNVMYYSVLYTKRVNWVTGYYIRKNTRSEQVKAHHTLLVI